MPLAAEMDPFVDRSALNQQWQKNGDEDPNNRFTAISFAGCANALDNSRSFGHSAARGSVVNRDLL